MPPVTPVAVFSYNRPEHLRLALETLSACRRLEECAVVIFCDGAKRKEHEAAVEASRAVAREWAPALGAKIVERAENLGLAKSIVAGTSHLCKEHGRAIVVEDDFALSPDFLDYMLQALNRYAESEEVWQISGYMFPVEHQNQSEAFFLHQATTWGWATWERAWRHFDWLAEGSAQALSKPEARRAFDLDGSYPYSKMLEDRLAGRNDSWGILWWWCMFRGRALALHPARSLVWVGGADGSGTHFGNAQGINQQSLESFKNSPPGPAFSLPREARADGAAQGRINSFLRSQQELFSPTVGGRIRRAVKKILAP